jgi:non-haem Fe2+, alpha-ketoglutarate-dependent halogenase
MAGSGQEHGADRGISEPGGEIHPDWLRARQVAPWSVQVRGGARRGGRRSKYLLLSGQRITIAETSYTSDVYIRLPASAWRNMSSDRESFGLSQEELDAFNRDGYIGPFDLYGEAEMESSLRALRPKLLRTKNAVYHSERSASGVTNLSSYDRHLDIDFLARHITRPEIVDRVASILGPDVLCWRSEFFPKYPGDEGTDWHQADNFSNVAGSKHPQIVWPEDAQFGGTITVWAAFTEATRENGCLQFIPGSHKTMNYDEAKIMTYDSSRINNVTKNGIRRGFFGYDYRQLQKDPDWTPDESGAVSQVMRQGQFVIFWSTLMHASHPHSGATDKMRLGFAARYLPTSVRVYPFSEALEEFGGSASLERFGCVLVSGRDEFQHNRFVDATVDGFKYPARIATKVGVDVD